MGAFTRLRASLGRSRRWNGSEEPCKMALPEEDDNTRTLRNGKVIHLPCTPPASDSETSGEASASTSHSLDDPRDCVHGQHDASPHPESPNDHHIVQVDAFSKEGHPHVDDGGAMPLGSCAICWRDFGTETPLDCAAVVKDPALDAVEPHMFCVRCLAEVCWRHHVAIRKSLLEGTPPPHGPCCPKCRFTFSHVFVHPSNDILNNSMIQHMADAACPIKLDGPALPSINPHGVASQHTRELNFRQLMMAVGPPRLSANPLTALSGRAEGGAEAPPTALGLMLHGAA